MQLHRLTPLGVPTTLREWGAGEPVVALHGLPTSGLLFRRLAPLLADQGYLLCAPDLPGFGESEDLEDRSVPAYGRWLAALLHERFEGRPVHLIGQDYGGLLAAWACSATPALSLTLSSCPLDADWRWLRLTALPGLRAPFYRWLKGGLYLFTAVPASCRAGFLGDHLARARADAEMAPRMEAIAAALSGRQALRLLGQVGATPTLCLWGAEDRVFSTARGRATAAALPEGRYRELSGARHGAVFSHPRAFALEWLAAFTPPRRAAPSPSARR